MSPILTTKQKMAIARVLQKFVFFLRFFSKSGTQTLVKRQGITWSLDLREGIDFSIWLLGCFEPKTLSSYKKIIKNGDTVLDIGANIGAHTLPIASLVGPQGKVFAFEPTDYAFKKLLKNCQLNPGLSSQIKCFQYLLSDSDASNIKTPPLYSSWPLDGDIEGGKHALHQGHLMMTDGAKMRKLDTVCRELNITRISCIKLDIDGYESSMLKGAIEIMANFKPIIIMELAPYALDEQGTSLAELINILKHSGYALYDLSQREPLTMDAESISTLIPKGSSINVIAKPHV